MSERRAPRTNTDPSWRKTMSGSGAASDWSRLDAHGSHSLFSKLCNCRQTPILSPKCPVPCWRDTNRHIVIDKPRWPWLQKANTDDSQACQLMRSQHRGLLACSGVSQYLNATGRRRCGGGLFLPWRYFGTPLSVVTVNRRPYDCGSNILTAQMTAKHFVSDRCHFASWYEVTRESRRSAFN